MTPDARMRVVVAAGVATVVAIAIVGVAVIASRPAPPFELHPRWVLAAGVAGLVAPVAGYRFHERIRCAIPAQADEPERNAAFQKATLVSLAVTEAVALGGVVVYLGSGEWMALSGVATHLLLAGAVWPSRARFESFLQSSPSETER